MKHTTFAAAFTVVALAGCSAAPPGFTDSGVRDGTAVDVDVDAARADVVVDDANTSTEDTPIVPEDDGALVCGGTIRSLSHAQAEILLVVDRSSSMLQPGTDGMPKWNELRDALHVVLPSVEVDVSMGLVAFPAAGVPNEAPGACTAPTALDVVPSFNNSAGVLRVLDMSSPAGGTPTNAALRVAAQFFATEPNPIARRFVVLATDGGPNCNANAGTAPSCRCSAPGYCPFGADSNCLDDAATLNTLRMMHANGIDTFVIGLPGTESLGDVLDAMADAGGQPRAPTPRYYNAGSTTEIESAFGSITSGLVNCRFHLDMAPPDPSLVDLRLGGTSLRYDPTHADGWDWSDATHTEIVFYGATCTNVRTASGGTPLVAAFGCPPPG